MYGSPDPDVLIESNSRGRGPPPSSWSATMASSSSNACEPARPTTPPGGGIEPGETIDVATVREAFEETGSEVEVEVIGSAAQVLYDGNGQAGSGPDLLRSTQEPNAWSPISAKTPSTGSPNSTRASGLSSPATGHARSQRSREISTPVAQLRSADGEKSRSTSSTSTSVSPRLTPCLRRAASATAPPCRTRTRRPNCTDGLASRLSSRPRSRPLGLDTPAADRAIRLGGTSRDQSATDPAPTTTLRATRHRTRSEHEHVKW